MNSGDEQACAARQVLAGTFHGVLSTHSLEHGGYPFGSVVPYVLDQDGLPLLLLSHLSQHTKNLDVDGRCGLTVIEEGDGDVQERGRLSAVGDVRPSGPDADSERYFLRFPQARMYFEQLAFRFYRFTPLRFHWNGGFTTARWFSVDRILHANPLSREEQARIVAHMNQNHADALRTWMAGADGNKDADGVTMLGIDAEGIERTMTDSPLAVVTGAYRRLGLESCRQLAERGYRVVLTARRKAEGQAAAARLADHGLDVRFRALAVTDAASVQRLRDGLREELGRIDCLVNNAGIFPDPAPGSDASSIFQADLDTVRRGLETNTLGALRVCQALIPLMEGYGRVVNVSSGMGQLSDMNGCCPGYRLSKTALNAVTRILADELIGTGIKVNAVCPGRVRTDMGSADATLSVEEGARGIVWAATLPDDGPSGGFFRHGELIAW